MEIRKLMILCIAMLVIVPAFGQKKRTADHSDDEEYFEPGADIIIGAGIYFGSKKTAGYYSGIPTNENNLNYIFGNYSWNKQIIELIANNHPGVSPGDTTIGVKEYPMAMRYKPAMSVGIGASYRFDKHWRISIYYTFARLTAKDIFTVRYENFVPGNQRNDYLTYLLIGKENRSFIDLTGSYTFHVNRVVKPFIEFGAQFNFVRVKKFDAVIEEREFSLLDIYGGNTYVQGVDMQTIDQRYGGPGFAILGNVGIKLAFNKAVSVDPCFYISWGKIGLEDYKDFHLNYGAYVRIVMSDAMFKR